MPLFQITSEAYFKNPKIPDGEDGGDEMLGFGTGEAVKFLTPIALAAVSALVEFLTKEVLKEVFKSEQVKKRFRKFRSASPAEEQTNPSLTPDQARRAHQVIVERIREALPEDQAQRLADSIIGGLVVAPQ